MTSRLPFSLLLLAAAAAHADRGALSVDVGGGGVATMVPAPYAQTSRSTLAYGGTVTLGVRYALSNNLELSLSGFFDPPFTVYQNGVTTLVDGNSYPGTLEHTYMRGGATAGAHLVWGARFRFHVGAELGWLQESFSSMKAFEDSVPGSATNYGLTLPDFSRPAAVVAPFLGLEFVGDHWGVALLPRAQFAYAFGHELSWSIVVPLQVSWKWFIVGAD